MATAAVVIVAATLTLTIQRDPEIDRLYDKYDKPSPVMRERSEASSADKLELEASSADKLDIETSGTVARESVLAPPKLPAVQALLLPSTEWGPPAAESWSRILAAVPLKTNSMAVPGQADRGSAPVWSKRP